MPKPSMRRDAAPKKNDAAPKRAYLSRDVRRQTLLSVAASIVESEGWAALNMSALAERGGISRQLVYQHFPSLEKLLADTAWYIFSDTMQGTKASIAAHPASLTDAVKEAEAATLDLPPGRGDALWTLIAGTAGASPELDGMRRGLRELIGRAWMPVVRKELGLSEGDARAYAWMTVMAFWGMRQMVRDGELNRARGVRLFNDMVGRVVRR